MNYTEKKTTFLLNSSSLPPIGMTFQTVLETQKGELKDADILNWREN